MGYRNFIKLVLSTVKQERLDFVPHTLYVKIRDGCLSGPHRNMVYFIEVYTNASGSSKQVVLEVKLWIFRFGLLYTKVKDFQYQ